MSPTKSRTSTRSSRVSPRRTIPKGFRERLTELRLEHRLTIDQFAERFSAKPTTVRDWLNAKVLPRADALIGVACSFGVSIDWLLGIEGAPKHPTQWRKASDFADDLTLAVIDNVKRRGGVAAELIDEFEVNGRLALEQAADEVERSVVASADQLAAWIAHRDALMALESELNNLGRMTSAMNTAFRPTSPNAKEERVLALMRAAALQTLAELADHGSRMWSAVSQSLEVLDSSVSGNPSLRSVHEGAHVGLATLAGAKALASATVRDLRAVDRESIEENLAAMRRVADRHRKAERRAIRDPKK